MPWFVDSPDKRDRINALLDLIEVDSDVLREAEFMQVQSLLQTMVGQTIASVEHEETRIVVKTSDGSKYFFYGFLGAGR